MSNQPTEAEVIPAEQTALAVRPTDQALTAAPAAVPVQQPITAAQAKVEAIAHLTMQAYERAAMLELTTEEMAKLQAEFPDEAFKPGAAGKEHLIYIEHAYLRDRFNEVFGMGKWAIVPRSRWSESFKTQKNQDAERVYVEAMLVVRGCFVGEAVGAMEYFPSNASQNYGDAVEGAKTAAFRRCAKEFGVGLQAWKKDFCDGWWKRRRQPQPPARTPNAVPTRPATAPAAPAAPSAPPKPAAEPAKPTQRTLEWFQNEMAQFGNIARDYFREIGVLAPTEEMANFPIDRCPTSRHTVDGIKKAIQQFHAERSGTPSAPSAPSGTTAPTAAPAQGSVPHSQEPGYDDPPCFAVIVPIPRKGQKRADYILNPDTIGSLYYAMKNGDEQAQHRLWGFVKHYKPEGWTKRDGTPMPPNQTDIDFRAALDAFADWHEHEHKGEQNLFQ